MSAEGEHFKEIKAVEQEREEMKKENKSLLSKITQLKHEMKQKEADFNRLKDSLSKPGASKKSKPMNSKTDIDTLNKTGPILHGKSSDHEFTFLVSKGSDEV